MATEADTVVKSTHRVQYKVQYLSTDGSNRWLPWGSPQSHEVASEYFLQLSEDAPDFEFRLVRSEETLIETVVGPLSPAPKEKI